MSKKTTKRSLLASVLTLVLCVAMLVGTTFAWFTDSASTGVNKIQAGNLDVALEMKQGDKWVSAEGETLQFKKVAGHENETVLWEPGCTYELPTLRVVNKGNLALKYKIEITGIKGDAKLNEVIDWTIGDVALGAEQHLIAGASSEFTIKGHMQESAGNEYQGLTIDGIGITVYATQDTVESDSFTNEYDKDAEYPAMVSELKAKYGVNGLEMPGGVVIEPAAAKDGSFIITLKDEEAFVYFTQVFDREAARAAREVALRDGTATRLEGESVHNDLNMWYYSNTTTFKLDCDVDLAGAYVKPFTFGGNNFIFDGQGHTIKNAKIAVNNSKSGAFFGLGETVSNVVFDNIRVTAAGCEFAGVVMGYSPRSITNVTVKNSSVTGGKYTGAIIGDCYGNVTDCTVENTVVSGQYKVGGIAGYVCNEDANVDQSITGNKLTDVTIKGENLLSDKTEFVIGKVVGHWNKQNNGNAVCKDNTLTNVTGATEIIGKIGGIGSVTVE